MCLVGDKSAHARAGRKGHEWLRPACKNCVPLREVEAPGLPPGSLHGERKGAQSGRVCLWDGPAGAEGEGEREA